MKKQVMLLLLTLAWSSLTLALDSSEIRNPGNQPAPHQYTDPKEAIAHVPPFTTDTRTDKLIYYPCTNCHGPNMVKPNPQVREMADMHAEIQLNHGGGRFWCLTCHGEKDRNHLISLKQQPISFNQSYLLCGQCHFARQKDFFFGAHGKRKSNWNGEKRLTNCTECHNPHAPAILPRLPRSKPVARYGLEVTHTKAHGMPPIWNLKHKPPVSNPSQESEQ